MTAFERIVEAIQRNGQIVRPRGDRQASAQCPAHEDRDPSLSLTRIEGSVLVHCHGGCDTDDVLAALGMTKGDLYDEPAGATYSYDDGRVVHRSPEKRFRQSGNTKGTPVLYRLDAVKTAVLAGQTIYLVEGEKDVLAIESIGHVATTTPQGASNVDKADLSPLHGAHVVAIVDKDDPGRKWAAKVATLLDGTAASLTFKEALTGKDAADHIAADHDLDDLVDLHVETDREPLPRLWPATALAGVQQPSWLAKQRLPRSAVTILVGDEGIGKSLLWVWIVAAVTTGKPLPEFGIPVRAPELVFIVITEDEWSYTVRPRLEVAGADLSMIRVICAEKDGSGSPIFPRDLCLITGSDPKPALVIVDAFLDTVSGNLSMRDPQQARQALHPWKEAATVTGAAIMLLTHTNRVDSKNARDRYGITGELRKKARMTLYAQQDDEGCLVVGPEKSNITGRVPASRFTIDPIQQFTPTEDHDGTVPLLRYVGESQLSAREHLEQNYDTQHGEDAQEHDEAVEWLKDYLISNGGQAEAKDVIKAGIAALGVSKQTLTRVRTRAKVRSVKDGLRGGWVWSLPEELTKNSEEPTSQTLGSSGSSVSSSGEDIAAMWDEVDDRPVCSTCNKRMGKAEAEVGQCIMCQRIATANDKARTTTDEDAS